MVTLTFISKQGKPT